MNSYWDKDLIRTSFWLCWALPTFIMSPRHNRENWPLVGRRCLPLAQFANLQLPVEVIGKSVRPSWRCDTATTASAGTALLVLQVETTWPLFPFSMLLLTVRDEVGAQTFLSCNVMYAEVSFSKENSKYESNLFKISSILPQDFYMSLDYCCLKYLVQ